MFCLVTWRFTGIFRVGLETESIQRPSFTPSVFLTAIPCVCSADSGSLRHRTWQTCWPDSPSGIQLGLPLSYAVEPAGNQSALKANCFKCCEGSWFSSFKWTKLRPVWWVAFETFGESSTSDWAKSSPVSYLKVKPRPSLNVSDTWLYGCWRRMA